MALVDTEILQLVVIQIQLLELGQVLDHVEMRQLVVVECQLLKVGVLEY